MEEYEFLANCSNKPKEFFKELRKKYNLTVNDVLIKCDISKYVYDRLISKNKISKDNVKKICIGLELNHPYGRFGTKINIFEEMTHTEHLQFHKVYGYGNGNGGFNRYYPFNNAWWWFYWLQLEIKRKW